MDAAAHYRHLMSLGRAEFLAAAAPAAFVRYPSRALVGAESQARTIAPLPDDDTQDAPLDHALDHALALELYPLVKKPGASFPDRITIGRTHNNDIVIVDHSVSRLHAYVRQQAGGWVVADAGSKNGSWLRGATLEARQEQALASHVVLRLGEVDLTFFVASDLFDALGGS